MNAYELAKKLFDKESLNYNEGMAVEQTIIAYSDSHDELEHDDRNLNFFTANAVNGEMAIKIADRCIQGYNNFDKEAMEAVVALFGLQAHYFFARESSVAVYVKPVDCIRVDLDFCFKMKADEFYFDGRLGMFRIWWD